MGSNNALKILRSLNEENLYWDLSSNRKSALSVEHGSLIIISVMPDVLSSGKELPSTISMHGLTPLRRVLTINDIVIIGIITVITNKNKFNRF